ncbi:DUF2955 domain-containing protein [Lysobacter sp. TY2-98]|nr:DUF2955 domain-containing protein [Lysobacter sp. TY2-98]
MPLPARRTFRLGAVAAVALALAYGFALPLPFFAPLLALIMTATPSPPMRTKQLLGLLVVVTITLGVGLVMAPMLRYYPLTGVMLVAVGVFVSTYLGVGKGKAAVSTLLTIGLTMIPAAGLMAHTVAVSVVQALLIGLGVAIVAQWLVYPWFPEDPIGARAAKPTPDDSRESLWLALRTMVIVMPPVLLAFVNPSAYMAIIMKAALLGQQGGRVSAVMAGQQLIGSTLLAGVYAFAFWFGLTLWPSLWMFVLWMLLFGMHFGRRMYGVARSRQPPSFWLNVGTTMLILIGPAVEDSSGGDVYTAFVQRFVLFVLVTLYAWGAILVLEWLRARRVQRTSAA